MVNDPAVVRLHFDRLARYAAESRREKAPRNTIHQRADAYLAALCGGGISARSFDADQLSLRGARTSLAPLTLDHVAYVRREHNPHAIISHSWRKDIEPICFGDVRVAVLPLQSWYSPGCATVLLMRTEVPAWALLDAMAALVKEAV
jgi:hypothetical protein